MRLIRKTQQDDITGMAAEMAYRFLFSLFPLLLFLVAALGFLEEVLSLQDLFTQLLGHTDALLPPQIRDAIERYAVGLLERQSAAALSIGLLGSLWGAAGAVGTLIKGLNRAYGVERPRPFWRRQLLALGMTLILPPIGVILFTLGSAGTLVIDGLGGYLRFPAEAIDAIIRLRWLALFVVLLLGFSAMYQVLPNVRHAYRSSLPGAAVAATGWLLLSRALDVYLSNFARYDVTYGSFGAAAAFLLWLYVTGLVALSGAEVNSVLAASAQNSEPRLSG